MNECDLITCMLSKDNYNQFYNELDMAMLSKQTNKLLSSVNNYWQVHDSIDNITLCDFATWFLQMKTQDMHEQEIEDYKEVFKTIDQNCTDANVREVIKDLKLKSLKNTIQQVISSDNLDIDDIKHEIEKVDDVYDKDIKPVTLSIDPLLEDNDPDVGYTWHLDCLNKNLGKLKNNGDFILVAATPGAGKCLSPSTPVLMYNGETKLAKEVKLGDSIMGPDSKPRKVLSLGSGTEEMYRIKLRDGSYFECNASHILSLKRSRSNVNNKHGDILNVELKEYMTWTDSKKSDYKAWKTGVDFKPQETLIDPYMLGLWLGDGTASKPEITNPEIEIHNYIKQYAAELNLRVSVYEVDRCPRLNIVGSNGKFLNMLREYDLMNNKHIPKEYLLNTREVRLQLLAGLLDTDGYMYSNMYEIVQKSETLADNIMFLANSLGYYCTRRIKYVDGNPYHRMSISGNTSELPILLERKKTINTARYKGHQGFTVTPLGVGKYCGFTLDKDHLYMLGNFITTHNTSFTAHLIGTLSTQLPMGKRILWLNNERGIKKIVPRVLCSIVGECWDTIQKEHGNGSDFDEYLLNNFINENNIIFYDIHSFSSAQVERLIKKHKKEVEFIVLDMIDKVELKKGGSTASLGNTDAYYAALYGWVLDLSCKYATVIGTSQINSLPDYDEYRNKYPMLKDLTQSKTGKSGAASIQLMLGKWGENNYRYLNNVKNKNGTQWKAVLMMEPQLSRFKEV